MKYANIFVSALLLSVIISGCASVETASQPVQTEISFVTSQTEAPSVQAEAAPTTQIETENAVNPQEEPTDIAENVPETVSSVIDEPPTPTTIAYPDWSSYFEDLNGSAVIFDPDENTCLIYNEVLASTRRSPCSTFKIISSLAGLESGVMNPDYSTRSWSGEAFWNDDWNQDMDFPTAFRTSCVWYYRQVIDDIGPETIQATLNMLHYGNCDITDWEGHLNSNNQNPALTGFWIESSLKISPREQVSVMERIFGSSSEYSPDILASLENVMLLQQDNQESYDIYGKTGMGKADGIVVDAWYTGFADVGRRIYFCIYLGETPNQNVSSTLAREIAVSLINENF